MHESGAHEDSSGHRSLRQKQELGQAANAGAGTGAVSAYNGTPFRLNRAYAERFGNAWVVLSAKYGLIEPTFMIPGPYEVSFKDPKTNPIGMEELRVQVECLRLHRYGVIVGLGGKQYRRAIVEAFYCYAVQLEFPFAGLPIGKMLQATKSAIRDGRPGFDVDARA